MPVTKTAKRALRSSKRKKAVNDKLRTRLDKAINAAKKEKSNKAVRKAISLADKAAKKNIIHKNKAARLKSFLEKLVENKPSKKSHSVSKTKVSKSKKK